MKKKFLSLLLALAMCLSLSVPTWAETTSNINSYSFDVLENGLHIAKVILVENGISRQLTKEEYLNLSPTFISASHENTMLLPIHKNDIITPRGYTYSFSPTSSTVYHDSSLARRVSAIFQNVSSLSVSTTMTYARTVSSSGGISLTTSILDVIDAEVNAEYGYSQSATSSTATSITGTFAPTGNYTYSAVCFKPAIATVRGVLTETLTAMGSSGSTQYTCTFKYPVSGATSGILDGIYYLAESNSYSAFPALA